MIFPSLLLLTLGLFQRKFLTTCVLVSSPPKQTINSVDEINDDEDSQNPNNVVLIPEQSINLDPDDPLSSINIDYMKNAVILQFRRNSRFFNDGSNNGRNDWETKRRLDNNFMRFGRSNDDNSNGNLMRFGKRQLESYKDQRAMEADEADGNRYERSNGGSSRDSRGDNFMRFGRSDPQNFMRFGRPDNLMRFGRPDNLMRFGRSSSDNLMRFGRPDNLMRFGRQDNLMRFGRPDHFMRFGRNSSPNLMRFGRNDKNFMRFGKLDQNFMRFGKRNDKLIEKLDENKNDNMKNTSNFTDKTKSRNNLDVLFKPHSNSDLQSNENDLDFDDNVY